MRNLIISLMALVVISAQAQEGRERFSNYVPRTLSAGTAMTARTMNTSLDDTTATISTIGYTYVATQITATSDSIGVLVAWRGSRDGSTWTAFATEDSVISRSSGVTGVGSVALPAKAMAFPYVQLRYTDSADAGFGANPSPTLRIEVVRRY